MNYDEIERLRSRHAAWSLLNSEDVALVLSFLGRVFIDANASNMPASQLEDALDDELFALNQRLGEARFPRHAREYLDYWAAPVEPREWCSGGGGPPDAMTTAYRWRYEQIGSEPHLSPHNKNP